VISFEFVVIQWEDSRQPTSSWAWVEDVDVGVVPCVSAGWLIHDGEDVKAIAANLGDDGKQASGVIRIPTRCIIKISKVKLPKGYQG
jgi:hypothetical protein